MVAMPALQLHPPTLDCADELLRFETDNRAFFEARINSRPPAYYSIDGVRAAIVLAEREAAADFAPIAQTPNWTNWPKWTKWANWSNK